MPPLLKALRPAQWAKNLFVLAPVMFGRGLFDPPMLSRAVVAFAAFCAAASAVYLVNDIRDREEDRRHPLKKYRPIAAGSVSVGAAAALAALLIVAALGASVWLGVAFLTFLGAYLVVNGLYTAGLKKVVILDLMIVSVCFVLRVLAGGAAVDVEISRWLLLCTIFVSLFLVMSKRRHEITLLGAEGASHQRHVLADYSPALLDQMINVVTASAVVCYALFAVAPETEAKYNSELLVYTLPLVLFGIFRYQYLIYQKQTRRNPTEAMVTDLPFVLNLALWGLVVTWIVYGTQALL